MSKGGKKKSAKNLAEKRRRHAREARRKAEKVEAAAQAAAKAAQWGAVTAELFDRVESGAFVLSVWVGGLGGLSAVAAIYPSPEGLRWLDLAMTESEVLASDDAGIARFRDYLRRLDEYQSPAEREAANLPAGVLEVDENTAAVAALSLSPENRAWLDQVRAELEDACVWTLDGKAERIDADYDAWFRRRVQAALESANAGNLIPAEEVEAEAAAWRAATRRKLEGSKE
ncbi:hypothetical protein [Xanthomonas citri]|uniref:hypothetical protein n=1 Tax=Xanthomonas citri TaxID=346 RepID=UPI0002C3D3DA|nr:hypothetical protein [Xanthomonas citri]AGI10576.1 hypothetical protein XCAW_b00056 [Xanthomonas citri subsp. citri Aw12879]AJZ42235.1 hypothetical protein J165_00069 [Xanthomonas citri pv. citri]AJZ46850.1 hypothetical protein J166_00069 [Xanthomonas citri pv. citri]AJZ51470.1 hypothetical protein J167_00069 [Xanthomonas citri pv. citri]AJZ64265.1 hypothetical protein J168_00069 [Xanthomonas citri pv. citri]